MWLTVTKFDGMLPKVSAPPDVLLTRTSVWVRTLPDVRIDCPMRFLVIPNTLFLVHLTSLAMLADLLHDCPRTLAVEWTSLCRMHPRVTTPVRNLMPVVELIPRASRVRHDVLFIPPSLPPVPSCLAMAQRLTGPSLTESLLTVWQTAWRLLAQKVLGAMHLRMVTTSLPLSTSVLSMVLLSLIVRGGMPLVALASVLNVLSPCREGPQLPVTTHFPA